MTRFERLQSLKCDCPCSEMEEVEGLPNCLRCTSCKGWFALRIGSLSDLDKLEAAFPADDPATDVGISDVLGL